MEEAPPSQAIEAPETSRRRFLKRLLGALAAVNVIIAGIPFIGALFGSSRATSKEEWTKVADMHSLPEGKPMDLRFTSETEEAFLHNAVLHSVWVIKHSPQRVTVFSPICPHLGCYYQWNGQSGHFECPCHASVFAPDGSVLGGPAPRALDTLPSRIENGALLVQWKRFKVGLSTKEPVV